MIRINADKLRQLAFTGARSIVVQSTNLDAGQTVDVVHEMDVKYAILTVDGEGDYQVVYRIYIDGDLYAEFTAGDIVIDSYANARIRITATNTDNTSARKTANLKLTLV